MTATLDRAFRALSDPTRRRMVQQLRAGPASISELAAPLPITLAAVVQHAQVLEAGRLIRTRKVGRVRRCELNTDTLDTVTRWLSDQRAVWDQRLDRLGTVLDEQAAR